MIHQSPSSLANLSLCRRFTSDEAGNAAASAGTLFHSDLEYLVTGFVPAAWEKEIAKLNRSEDHRQMLRDALAQVEPLLSLGLPVKSGQTFMYENELSTIMPGVYVESSVELWPDDPRHKVGRIDLLIVMDDRRAIVVDWKSNTQEADFSWQLGAYACALNRLCSMKWNSIVCKVVAPNLEQHDDVLYDTAALADMEREIVRLEEEVANPFTPPCPGQTQCRYCRCARLTQCPALAETAARQLPTEYVTAAKEVVDAPRILLAPQTLEERAHRRDWLSVMTLLSDFIKEDDKLYFLVHTNDSLPGFKVSTRPGNRQIDKTRLMELNKSVMDAFGLNATDYLSFVEPCKKPLLEAGTLAMGSRKQAEEKYSEAIEPFTVRGANIVTVRRDAARKLVKPKEMITDK